MFPIEVADPFHKCWMARAINAQLRLPREIPDPERGERDAFLLQQINRRASPPAFPILLEVRLRLSQFADEQWRSRSVNGPRHGTQQVIRAELPERPRFGGIRAALEVKTENVQRFGL